MTTQSHQQNQYMLGIIGHRLSHTLSPVMHTTAFKSLHLNYTYGVMDVIPDMLPNLIASLRTMNFRGANVTVPYKQAVISLIDEVTEDASVIGAVNTIVNNGGRLTGYNTDVDGIVLSLKPYENKITKSNVVIFGAGGAARATVYALAKYVVPATITLLNRTAEHAQAIANDFNRRFPSTEFRFLNDAKSVRTAIEDATLIINTTSLGMKPNINTHPLPLHATLHSRQIVFDVVYNPIQTALLQIAENAGATIINGVEMLLGQGATAFQLFTGTPFPTDIAREAVMKELTETGSV
ncbi:MAG: shikimate dehydrogenase [Bacteroidota bacterium]